jgi:hypothetical protein
MGFRTGATLKVSVCGLLVAGCGEVDRLARSISAAAAVRHARPTPVATMVRCLRPSLVDEVRSRIASPSRPPAAEPDAASVDQAPAAPCPADMALVEGDFCRHVEQRCLAYAQDPKGGPDRSRCARFEQPSRCISDAPAPRAMRFCMDRYEYPNQKGEVPLTLVDWGGAQALCRERGKRLCTESEFNFACEGERMQPYATGFVRDADRCNIDRPFRRRRVEMKPLAECMADPACQAEFARLDQREPAGSRAECVSPFGVHDLNGNVNEWVSMPWMEPPHRAAIKGGWWGPVRNRCRPIVTSHDERYVGYEVGFRCCREAAAD